MTDFERFWASFPRKVGRLAAAGQFGKAVKLASLEDILAGVERYKATKPAYADWCHPVTWLRQGRWMDEPDAVPACQSWDCQHLERCGNQTTCRVKDEHPDKYPVKAVAS